MGDTKIVDSAYAETLERIDAILNTMRENEAPNVKARYCELAEAVMASAILGRDAD